MSRRPVRYEHLRAVGGPCQASRMSVLTGHLTGETPRSWRFAATWNHAQVPIILPKQHWQYTVSTPDGDVLERRGGTPA